MTQTTLGNALQVHTVMNWALDESDLYLRGSCLPTVVAKEERTGCDIFQGMVLFSLAALYTLLLTALFSPLILFLLIVTAIVFPLDASDGNKVLAEAIVFPKAFIQSVYMIFALISPKHTIQAAQPGLPVVRHF